MAYDNSNEIRTDLGKIRKNARGEFIAVTKIEYTDKDAVQFDIRNMYTGDDDELKFTAKGVRMNDEIAFDVVKSMVLGLSEEQRLDLMDFMGVEEKEQSKQKQEEN